MNVVILGCGRVGAAVAAALETSHAVTVVDWNPRSLSRLPEHFDGRTVVGNGIDVDLLRSAGAGEADAFIAATDSDNSNIMAAQVAAHLGAKHVVARVYDAERARIFRDDTLITFSPTISGAQRLFDLIVEGAEE